MKVIIVDDSRLARKEIANLCAQSNFFKVVGEADNISDAEQQILNLEPDLVFLDIQMPGGSGFELLEKLTWSPLIIFTTAYDEYAVKAFEYNTLDYLLKPISEQRWQQASLKAQREFEQESQDNSSNAELLNNSNQVFLKDGEKCWFVKLEQIHYFESVGNYVKVHFDDVSPMIHKSLNKVESRLNKTLFFRANRQTIINLAHIQSIEPWISQGLKITLNNGQTIVTSRRAAQELKQKMSL